jgi:hypothetical protein
MTFAEIIPGLLDGKRYRVSNGSYVIWLEAMLMIQFEGGRIETWIGPWSRDLTRDDWEVVD